MASASERTFDAAPGITALLVLAAGFVALYTGDPAFWLYWVVGFTVVVPLVAMLAPDVDSRGVVSHCVGLCRSVFGISTEKESESASTPVESETGSALDVLRDRYARGDLTEEQFERKLDLLLDTETPEDAEEWRAREIDELAVE